MSYRTRLQIQIQIITGEAYSDGTPAGLESKGMSERLKATTGPDLCQPLNAR
jgi:hypothetical protein